MTTEIVVGVDFGTTHSGVSWAVNRGKKDIRLVDDWPNPRAANATHEKVPTIISYENGKPNSWGYNVKPGEQSFRWFKVFLDPAQLKKQAAEPVVASMRMMEKLQKTVDEVIVDYMRFLWAYTKADIANLKGENWQDTYSMRVVITVPAIWSDVAKTRTKKAAIAAGMGSNIFLVSEPEAAAHAVLKEKDESDPLLKPGDTFVVCDAGGGTVDLISYNVVNVNPLRMEECVVGDGGLCGSVFVDIAFEKHIKTLIGESAYNNLKVKAKSTMLGEFEHQVKRQYTGESQDFSVQLYGVDDNPDVGIVDDTVILKGSLVKTLFDHIANQIVHLVEKQIDDAQEKKAHVKAILLVGGFGGSKYLHKRLKDAHNGDGIEVLQVHRAWSSICRGATMWGLENAHSESLSALGANPKTVVSRLARFNYGICLAIPFDPSVHQSKDRVTHPNGGQYADNQMDWIILKGDRMREGERFEVAISNPVHGVRMWSSGQRNFSQELWYCGDEEAPSRKEISVKRLCFVEYGIDCSKLWGETSYRDKTRETKGKWRDATFQLQIVSDSASLGFSVSYHGEPVAYTTANYKEDSDTA